MANVQSSKAGSSKVKVDFTSFSNIIAGKPVKSANTFHGTNPSTKKPLWEVPSASKQDLDRAVRAANTAQKEWAKKSWKERQQFTLKFKPVYGQYMEEIAKLLTLENGKTQMWANMEAGSCAFYADFHAALPVPTGESNEDESKIITTRFSPLGVVGAICPWNFPITLCFGKLFPALVAGNAIIVKPSPFTPYATLKMVEIAQQVFPPGLVQVLAGDNALGAALVEHPDIHKISFTGSMATGKKVMAAAAGTMKRVTLELGGNDPCIVLPDVNIDEVVPKIAMGSFMNTGQVCVATKRIFIHHSIYKPFLAALVDFTSQLKTGNPEEADTVFGPIQNSMQYEKVKSIFADTKRRGYQFAHGKDMVEESMGYFIQPTVIDNPPDDSRVVNEEAFGPIVPCQSWKDEEEVIRRANNTKAGLAASVFGKDLKRCQRIAERIEAGSVFINSSAIPTPAAPFGGWKESGIGYEWGQSGIKAYMNMQAIHMYKPGAKPFFG